MKVYLCWDNISWRDEEKELLGVFLHEKDAIDMALASGIIKSDLKDAIKAHEVIE